MALPMNDASLYGVSLIIRQALARLRSLGYQRPDFGHGDLGMQDDMLIVLGAPEEFGSLVTTKGWKNLAAEYFMDNEDDSSDVMAEALSRTLFLHQCASWVYGDEFAFCDSWNC
jgi:hypothetical protein